MIIRRVRVMRSEAVGVIVFLFSFIPWSREDDHVGSQLGIFHYSQYTYNTIYTLISNASIHHDYNELPLYINTADPARLLVQYI